MTRRENASRNVTPTKPVVSLNPADDEDRTQNHETSLRVVAARKTTQLLYCFLAIWRPRH